MDMIERATPTGDQTGSEDAPSFHGLSRGAMDAVSRLTQTHLEPFFFYDLDSLQLHIGGFADVVSNEAIRLFYACKANPNSAVIRAAERSGVGFDVSSPGELRHVLAQGVEPSRIVATGPAKSKMFLRDLYRSGVRKFVVESPNQMRWLDESVRDDANSAEPPQVLLRLQISSALIEPNVVGGRTTSVFGMDAESWLASVADRNSLTLDIRGIHVFQWSNITDPSTLVTTWTHYARGASAMMSRLGVQLQVLDVGGGLGIPYSVNDQRLAWQDILDAAKSVRSRFGIEELWIEPGRFVTGPFGVYATPVVDRKRVFGQDLLITAGGINHLLRSALIGEPLPCVALSRLTNESGRGENLLPFRLHGPLCMAYDALGDFLLPANTGPGDWLIFLQAGSYGFTQSMPLFLPHDWAAEWGFIDGAAVELRKGVPAGDYLR